jgi:hypothetical protein
MSDDLIKKIETLCDTSYKGGQSKNAQNQVYGIRYLELCNLLPKLLTKIKCFQEQKDAWLKTLEKLGSLSIQQHENFNNLADFALKIIDEAEEQILAQDLEIKKLKLELAKYKGKE